MKQEFLVWLGLLGMIGILCPDLSADVDAEKEILPRLGLQASGTLDVYSRYVWRGFTLDTDPVVQPGFNIGGYGLTVSFWSSFDAADNDALSSDEVDFIMDYTKAFDAAEISLGHTYYHFPGSKTYSKEWYVKAAFTELLFSPVIACYFDYADKDKGGGGQYFNLSISHGISVVPSAAVTLDLAAAAGINDGLFIEGKGGDYTFNAAVTVPLTKTLSFSPGIGYAVPFGDLKSADDGSQKKRFFAGMSLGFSL